MKTRPRRLAKPDRAAARTRAAAFDAHAMDSAGDVLRLASIDLDDVRALLARYGLALECVADSAAIPGSYWGESEAGVIGHTVHVRSDTPVHSLLHEACHLIVAPPEKRATIHTNASDSQAEEDATCYLQIVLGDALPGVGSERIQADMDRWGYTFRLGSAHAWFERDAEDARAWLVERELLPSSPLPLAREG
jgi:hypothetical protein